VSVPDFLEVAEVEAERLRQQGDSKIMVKYSIKTSKARLAGLDHTLQTMSGTVRSYILHEP
jgi:hypothetical protein